MELSFLHYHCTNSKNMLAITALLVLSQATASALSEKGSRAINKRNGYIFWYWSIDTPTPGPVNNPSSSVFKTL
jgi:hypothetical protein